MAPVGRFLPGATSLDVPQEMWITLGESDLLNKSLSYWARLIFRRHTWVLRNQGAA